MFARKAFLCSYCLHPNCMTSKCLVLVPQAPAERSQSRSLTGARARHSLAYSVNSILPRKTLRLSLAFLSPNTRCDSLNACESDVGASQSTCSPPAGICFSCTGGNDVQETRQISLAEPHSLVLGRSSIWGLQRAVAAWRACCCVRGCCRACKAGVEAICELLFPEHGCTLCWLIKYSFYRLCSLSLTAVPAHALLTQRRFEYHMLGTELLRVSNLGLRIREIVPIDSAYLVTS